MADRDIKIQIIVDSKGALQAVGATDEQLDKLKETVLGMEADMDRLQTSFDSGLIDPSTKAQKEIKVLEKGLDSMLKQGVDPTSRGFQRYQEILLNVQGQVPEANSQLQAQTSAMLSLNQVVQDAPAGFRTMARNLGPLINRMQRLSSTSGGMRAALKGIVSTLTGPAGIALAVSVVTSALIQLAPKIVDAFKKGKQEAKSFRERVDEAVESMLKLDTAASRFEISAAQAAENVLKNLVEQDKLRQEIAELGGRELATATAMGQQSAVLSTEERIRLEAKQAQLERLKEEEQRNRDLITQHNALVRAAQDAEASGAINVENERELKRLQEERLKLQIEQNSLRPQTDIFSGMDSRRLAEFRAEAERARMALFPDPGDPPTIAEEAEDSFDTMIATLAQVERELRANVAQPMEALQRQIAAIREGLAGMLKEDPDADLTEPFQHMLGLMKDLEDQAASAADTIQDKVESIAEVGRMANQAFADVSAGIFGRQMNEIDARREAELDRIDAVLESETASEQEKIRARERRAKAEEKFREQEAKALRAQAKRQKAMALFDIAINTAVAVSKVWGQTGIFGIAAQKPVLIMGAAQAAAVAAQPIPRFRRGVDGFEGGAAVVGDVGAGDGETVVLPPHSNVITNENTKTLANMMSLASRTPSGGGGGIDVERFGKTLGKALEAGLKAKPFELRGKDLYSSWEVTRDFYRRMGVKID